MTSTIRLLLVPAVVSASLLALSAPAPARPMQDTAETDAGDQDDTATEDVLYLLDGRVFHGRLVSESRSEIVFEFIDADLNMRATLRFTPDQVDRIARDVPLPDAPSAEAAPARRAVADDESEEDEETRRTYGIRRGDPDDESLPAFYIVPMKGQMGTDVNVDVYERMIDDIRAADPDYLVIMVECRDSEDRLYSRIGLEEQGLSGSTFLDMYRQVIDVFKDELRDIPQVVWIKDSLGISSVIALAWPDLYMSPDARLGGIAGAARNFGVQDPEVHAKFREAYMGWLKGFAEFGGYDLDVLDAMVRPEFSLSATWQGREVDWALDGGGEYLVDGSDKRTVTFTAKEAEDFCLSDGMAESLDDLALYLGHREFRVKKGSAEAIYDDYVEDWRRAFDTCKRLLEEAQKFMGWATGEDTLKYLGRVKSNLEKVVSQIDRYKAVDLRLQMELGVRRFDLVTQIEILKEQIRALRSGGGGGGGWRRCPRRRRRRPRAGLIESRRRPG